MNAVEWVRTLRRRLLGTRIPEGNLGIKILGHRRYVGGRWDEMGRLQLDFMVRAGLQPSHVFLDVGCGSLRAGRHFIRYLDRGCYLGVEKEAGLVRAGLEKEVGVELVASREPEIAVMEAFEFERLSKVPDLSLANSLFSHLTEEDIRRCLKQLAKFVHPGHVFFATFFEGESDRNPSHSHDHGHFRYTRDELAAMGRASGWHSRYVGDWGHPRHQVMMRFEAR